MGQRWQPNRHVVKPVRRSSWRERQRAAFSPGMLGLIGPWLITTQLLQRVNCRQRTTAALGLRCRPRECRWVGRKQPRGLMSLRPRTITK